MRRDAVAAGPAAAGASPPIAAAVLSTDAVVIDVEGVLLPAEPTGSGCRICHLGPEDGGSAAPGSEVIRLGCGCKDELGAAHRQCAEAWFRIKGDRFESIWSTYSNNV
ncbi:hypothetical protein BAE44_0004529 [Dichanthelium oligosanthes]|uniref:RING-CH-type domain-containing protein n=1 Tax=Dichanthelium oligosanthes TaxID=888268 RepID=A0A1E5WAL7_9POAL|nr:hypothetical protein BAE44_0004529 [Dichanthelium oligosanthes]